MSELTGYADRASAAPGERVRFMVSTDRPTYDASVVRLLRGVSNASGPGLLEDVVAPALATGLPGLRQVVRSGSYVDAGDPEALRAPAAFTLHAWIWPTLPGDGREQGVLAKWSQARRAGFCLSVGADGRLRIRVGDGSAVAELAADAPLAARAWYFVAATFDAATGRLALAQHALSPWADPRFGWWEGAAAGPPSAHDVPLLIAAGGWDGAAVDLYDGKIDRPGISSRALAREQLDALRAGGADPAPAAAWDLGAEPAGHRAVDAGPHGLTSRLVNQPTRAVTGHDWTGRESDFRRAGEQYGAIHFHHDDVGDAGWEAGVEWTVPAGARSGVYALRVESGGEVDRIPFVVRPPDQDDQRPPVLVLLPTFTYLAYANLPLSISAQPNRPPDWAPPAEPADDVLARHPELGGSLYHVHADGSGVVYSSALRPVPTTRPTYRASFIDGPRHLAGDLQLIAWLEAKGIAYDVVADDDLHARGAELLALYRVVVTGGHPEYVTAAMLDALEGYVDGGGRLMYLGGNGFYWVTSVDPERPHVIEVRRGIAGSRPWESAPGELHHSTTGELGGLWRYRGALPNRLTGVAFSTEGVGHSGGYRRTDASRDPDVAFVFEGVGDDEPIGEFGLVMGSAVGDELDRADPGLGTPPEARVLATSVDVASAYRPCVEDDLRWNAAREMGVPRADMVYVANTRGGAVFSVGSISWIASLSHADYDNNVSRITENVLQRFAELDGAAT